MSRKQQLYLILLASGTAQIRNQQSRINSAPWWHMMPRGWRETARQCYEIAELLHHLPNRVSQEEFAESDIWFLNGPVRRFFQRAEPKTSFLYGLFLSPIRQLFSLVPDDLKERLKWSGPALPDMTAERQAKINDFLFYAVKDNENIETLRNALAGGADPNACDSNGETALSSANRLGKEEYSQVLKEAGAQE